MTICVLNENKICNECGECDRCDLDKNKVCDNCCKCLDAVENDYADILIADVVMNAADEFLAEYYSEEDMEDDYDESDKEYSEESKDEL